MTSLPHGPANVTVVERYLEKARGIYFRIDWLTVTVLAVIGLCAIGMFFIVVAVGEYRMSR